MSGEEQELWRRFHEEGDEEARDFLYLKYSPWARRVAMQVFGRLRVPQMDWGDFAQNAALGLLEAMSRFDPDFGPDFIAYAKFRIRGAVFNGVRVFLGQVDKRRDDRLQERLGDLSGETGGDLLANFVDLVSGLGLGLLLESGSMADCVPDAVEMDQMSRRVVNAMEVLSDRERLILTAHYFDGIPFVEIAERLALTKGRISQIHRGALGKLRAALSSAHSGQRSY